MSDNEIRVLATKVSRLLQENGGTYYNLHYTGAGDSTDGCESTVEPGDLTNLFEELKVAYTVDNSSWFNGKMVSSVRETTGSFQDAVYELASLLWDRAGQGGWYNNEGGYGEVTVLPGGFIEFRHVNYTNESYAEDADGNEIEVEQEEEEACHWRFNVLVGPIDAPYEETAET